MVTAFELNPVQLACPFAVPSNPWPVAVVGAGNITRIAHLPAYRDHGIPVAAIHDPSAAAMSAAAELAPDAVRVTSYEAILGNPAIRIVDITTHTAIRPDLIRQALNAGKHVFSQKPFAESMQTARELVALADELGVRLGVNQNGRHAPAFFAASELIRAGAIGEVTAISHTFEKPAWWQPGSVFDRMDHCGIFDYAIHWIDISRVWFGGETPVEIRARDYRTPDQPIDSHTPWGFWIELVFKGGRVSLIRGVGAAHAEHEGHPFQIYGTTGMIRGSELDHAWVELVTNGTVTPVPIEGKWFSDAFAGSMGVFMQAVMNDIEPTNSGRDNLGTLAATLAAVESADANGQAVVLSRLE